MILTKQSAEGQGPGGHMPSYNLNTGKVEAAGLLCGKANLEHRRNSRTAWATPCSPVSQKHKKEQV